MNHDSTDLASLTATQLSARIAAGELRCVELAARLLERIEAQDPKLHAFVEVYREDALAAAEGHDRLLRGGHRLGPLQGIPVALKDLCEYEGRVTTGGSALWKNRVSATTATVVRRVLAAGMVIVGKTHMVELALGGWGTNQGMGTPWNPRDRTTHRIPGGSSSGSGVAVAAGLVPVAVGSDTGGSIRLPCSFCGTVGLKPTFGRVSNAGILPLSPMLDTVGPMTRSVEDAELVFRAIHGPDPEDPQTLAQPAGDPLPALRAGVAGMRLAVPPGSELADHEPAVAEAFAAALRTLESLGARLVERPIQATFEGARDRHGRIMGAEGYAANRRWIEEDGLPVDQWVRERFLTGREVPAWEYLELLRERRAERAAFLRGLDGIDALLTPTTPVTAPALEQVDEHSFFFARYTRPVNHLGLCALALPSGRSASGLPTSLEIIGRPWDEATVLRIGYAFEREGPFVEAVA